MCQSIKCVRDAIEHVRVRIQDPHIIGNVYDPNIYVKGDVDTALVSKASTTYVDNAPSQ